MAIVTLQRGQGGPYSVANRETLQCGLCSIALQRGIAELLRRECVVWPYSVAVRFTQSDTNQSILVCFSLQTDQKNLPVTLKFILVFRSKSIIPRFPFLQNAEFQ